MNRNRIREVRKAKGLSLEDLEEVTGFSASYLSRMEGGKRNVSIKNLQVIAEALEVDLADLLAGGVQEVAIVGYIGAGQEVVPFDDHPVGEGLDKIEAPAHLGTVAGAIVRGDSMWPRYSDGEIILYTKTPERPDEYLHRECVVCLRDGRMYPKTLERGSRADIFTLVSHNAPPLLDQEVEWAAPVKWPPCIEKPTELRDSA